MGNPKVHHSGDPVPQMESESSKNNGSSSRPTLAAIKTAFKAGAAAKLEELNESQMDINNLITSSCSTLADKAFFLSLQPHLATRGGKRNAVAIAIAAFATSAFVLSIPTTKAFTRGAKGNLVHIFVILPIQSIVAMSLVFGMCSVCYNLTDLCREVESPIKLKLTFYLVTVGSWFVAHLIFDYSLFFAWVYPRATPVAFFADGKLNCFHSIFDGLQVLEIS